MPTFDADTRKGLPFTARAGAESSCKPRVPPLGASMAIFLGGNESSTELNASNKTDQEASGNRPNGLVEIKKQSSNQASERRRRRRRNLYTKNIKENYNRSSHVTRQGRNDIRVSVVGSGNF